MGTRCCVCRRLPRFCRPPQVFGVGKKNNALTQKLSKTVSVPDYTGQKVCGLTVHFLPCDELQVTTSCHAYGSPEYPIKTPLHLPEPQSCPK
ncbi:DUF3304 domain-containing protein [Pseudomonas syringae pv. theae]|nr:DUF3304 domain-containing protein [Pseudomonas syringae pv. theae]MBL3833945.1 DUF3304 domain-containing protein [Pseudomonas syringae pv. theae]MBL3869465.1 DUF3304 domain-containing protein [Pseudomonas syringae pv. theae]